MSSLGFPLPSQADLCLRTPPQASLGWQKAVGIQSQAHSAAPATPVTALLPAVSSVCPQAAPWLHLLSLPPCGFSRRTFYPNPFTPGYLVYTTSFCPQNTALWNTFLSSEQDLPPLHAPTPRQESLPSKSPSQRSTGRVIYPGLPDLPTGQTGATETPGGTILTPKTSSPSQ